MVLLRVAILLQMTETTLPLRNMRRGQEVDDADDATVDGGGGGGAGQHHHVDPELDRFERSSLYTRLFMGMNKCLEGKRACILLVILILVAVLLVTEFIKLFLSPGEASNSTSLQATSDLTRRLLNKALESHGILGVDVGGGGNNASFSSLLQQG